MWEKLKKLLKEDKKHNLKELKKGYEYFIYYAFMDHWILQQMEILEKENKNGETQKN